MSNKRMWTVVLAAALATVVWFKEYTLGFSGGSPRYHWWLAAITTYINSAGTSVLDYISSVAFWPFALTGSLETPIANRIFFGLSVLKATLDKLIETDAWWQDTWHNRSANWLGRFTFSLVISHIVFHVAMKEASTIIRYIRVGLVLLPLLGLFIVFINT